MSKQSIPKAFAIFFTDILKARLTCHLLMLGAIAAFIYVGYHLTGALAAASSLKSQVAGVSIIIEAIAIWGMAFIFGVKGRPLSNRDFIEFPPLRLTRGIFSRAFFFILFLGMATGSLVGVEIFMSLLYALAIPFAMMFCMVMLFAMHLPITQVGIKMSGEPTRAIADAYRIVWLAAGILVLIAYYILLQFANAEASPGAFLVILHASLVMGIFSTGYASGYYP